MCVHSAWYKQCMHISSRKPQTTKGKSNSIPLITKITTNPGGSWCSVLKQQMKWTFYRPGRLSRRASSELGPSTLTSTCSRYRREQELLLYSMMCLEAELPTTTSPNSKYVWSACRTKIHRHVQQLQLKTTTTTQNMNASTFKIRQRTKQNPKQNKHTKRHRQKDMHINQLELLICTCLKGHTKRCLVWASVNGLHPPLYCLFVW